MAKDTLSPSERTPPRRWLRWILRIASVVVPLVTVQIGFLTFPQVLLSNEVQVGSVVVHYRGADEPAITGLAKDVDHRLQAGGFGDPEAPQDIFFFREQGPYAFLARLARVPPDAQGFGISFLGNSFVSEPRVRALGERTGQSPTYSVWEGNVAHTMAHEIAHLILVDSIGRKAWMGLPHWKQEGFPEYIANIGLIRADTTSPLSHRIDILLDDGLWMAARGWDRIHYEAGLMVEFLLEVRDMGFRAALADSISRERTLSDMVEWSRADTFPPRTPS